MNIMIADVVEPVMVTDEVETFPVTTEPNNPHVKFSAWHDYLAALDPNDQASTFILPEESLPLSPSRTEVLSIIELAVERAFGRKAIITEFLAGQLQGNMRLLLPQGIEIAYSFDNEPAWRVELDLVSDAFCERTTLYFNSPRFNPLRIKADQDGVIGAMFTVAEDDVIWVKGSAETDNTTELSLQRLHAEFEQLQK